MCRFREGEMKTWGISQGDDLTRAKAKDIDVFWSAVTCHRFGFCGVIYCLIADASGERKLRRAGALQSGERTPIDGGGFRGSLGGVG